MANVINYATQFQQDLAQKYSRELLTAALTTDNLTFTGGKTVKVPFLTLKGFKDHSRSGGFNRQNVSNDYQTMTLSHDRDVEFFVDSMDIDETNQAVSAANLTNTFEEQFAIPEIDCYRISKMYADWTATGKTAVSTALTNNNVLSIYDSWMEAMDEAEVPMSGRILYVTPAVNKLIKTAAEVNRYIEVSDSKGNINRNVRSLDDAEIVVIPSSRMKTVYNFSDGFTPGSGAKQVNMLLVHPQSVIACVKHKYIRLWPEGSHTEGDGYLYQNRQYSDLFVIAKKANGIMIHAS